MTVLPPVTRGSTGNVILAELSNAGLQWNTAGLSIKTFDNLFGSHNYFTGNIESLGGGPPSPNKVRFGPVGGLAGLYGFQFDDTLFATVPGDPPPPQRRSVYVQVSFNGTGVGTFLIPIVD